MNGISIASITETKKSFPKTKNNPFNATMRTMYEAFRELGENVFDKNGYQNIIHNKDNLQLLQSELFSDITNESTLDALYTTMENGIMRLPTYGGDDYTDESGTVGNVTHYAYLNGPVLRAIWSRSIVAALMNVIPLKNTEYALTFDIPELINNGKTYDLPYSLVDHARNGDDDPIIGLTKLKPKGGVTNVTTATGAIILHDKSQSNNLMALHFANVGGGGHNNDLEGYRIDRNITVKDIVYEGVDNKESPTSAKDETIMQTFELSDAGGAAGKGIFICEFDGTYWNGSSASKEKVVLTITFDLTNGDFVATCNSPRVKTFVFDAYFSSEDNRNPAIMQTRQHSRTVKIGTGQHVIINTPVELLQEYPTSHQGADYAIAMTDIISEMYSGLDNVEMLQFLRKARRSSTTTPYIPKEVIRGINKDNAEFDVRVAHGENPSAYVDMYLKKCLTYHINDITAQTRLMDGWWSMVGHALNVMLIPDFKTTSFGQGEIEDGNQTPENLGFKVGYTLGFSSNIINGRVRCLYTPECSKESGIVAFFSSSDEKRPTYVCHPFSYTISRGYQNPHNPTIPATMVTKRRRFVEFVPSQFRLTINGNEDKQWVGPDIKVLGA